MLKNKHSGQSITEFVIASGVLVFFTISIPMIAKLGTVKLKTEQATNYAAWRVNKGLVKDEDTLSNEISQRFFARTGADVLTNRNADCDDAEGQDMSGKSLVNWTSVQAKLESQSERYKLDPIKTTGNLLPNLRSNGQSSVKLQVPINFSFGPALDVLIPSASNFTLESSATILRNTWQANNTEEIKNNVKKSSFLKPYETIQKTINQTYNAAVASMGFEKKIQKDAIYKMDIVPSDRKEKIQ
ncbi:hypothetical protein [Acinetobacter boissieri]|uniref:Uncharacterized protein n=1 Tax=Acinetobacter boissieri TaxID=1219383 RepID=A0A1G6JU66_9GAMM|nr:hypothetical protein [Acinetobacter boissieri]SDC22181.1 hypothetical protein SAMN05421733_11269 [Acinetobacter boissieri]